jgi:hypothetical protein
MRAATTARRAPTVRPVSGWVDDAILSRGAWGVSAFMVLAVLAVALVAAAILAGRGAAP